MDNKTKNLLLGSLGEDLVERVLLDRGNTVVVSPDPYDTVKDMTVNGISCEVKTKRLFINKNAFTVPLSQEKKCTEVEYLIFVETPSVINDEINIYSSPKESRQDLEVYKQRSGSSVLILPKEDMKLITTVNDPVIAQKMIELTATNHKWSSPKAFRNVTTLAAARSEYI